MTDWVAAYGKGGEFIGRGFGNCMRALAEKR